MTFKKEIFSSLFAQTWNIVAGSLLSDIQYLLSESREVLLLAGEPLWLK